MKLRQLLLGVMLTILAVLSNPNDAKADHCAGGELVYEWISDSTYRFILKFYRDCNGIDAYANQSLCMYDSCNNFSSSVTMNKWTGTLPDGRPNGSPVAAGCSGYPTKCESTSSSIPGYREWWYTCIVQLPSRCRYWKFAIWISARNYSLNIPGGNLYLETTFDNQNAQGNSSPYFSIKPVPYACINQATTYNNGAIDPDGDSLSTEILNPLTGSSCTSPPTNLTLTPSQVPPLSIPNNPFQTNNTFNTNAITGNLSFTPSVLGPGTVTVRTKEYRRGLQIGSIMRDVQVQVLACSAVVPTVSPITSTIVGGNYSLNRYNGCAGQNLSFCFEIKSTDTGAILIADDNHQFSMPAATITYTNQKSDSIVGCFNWTPSLADSGLRNLILTIKDSTCRPPGILLYQTFTLPIYIWPVTKAVPDTTICKNQTAYLGVSGGGNFQWSVLPGGSPITSLNNPNIQYPIATPALTTTYVVVSTANPYCNRNKDTVVVNMIDGPQFTTLKDTLTCPGNDVKLNLGVQKIPGVTYKFKWSPATYLNSDTLEAPIATPGDNITYTIQISSSQNNCKSFDTVFVDVLDGFLLSNQDTAICDGSQVKPNIIGDSRYTYFWSTTSTIPGLFSNQNIIDPVITPAPIGVNTYTVKASHANCPNKDSLASFKIDVQPVPTVTLGADEAMCEGDTFRLSANIFPSNYPFALNWTPGSSLDNPTIANPIFKATQTTELILTAVANPAGCTDSDTIKLTVFPANFITATGDTSICPGNSTMISVTGNGVKSFRWYPDYRISNPQSNNPTVNPTTTQVYTVYAVDTNSCLDTSMVKINVYPGAMIFLPDIINIYPGESYVMNPAGNCTYFSWFPQVGLSNANVSNPIAKPDVNTKYIVTATTESGCTVTDSVNVIVSSESILNLPNAFTPGNGPNGKFKLIRRGDATLKKFEVFNRWGQKVFSTTNIDEGWDGTFNGEPQSMGVYIYSVEAINANGNKFTKQGNVTLIR
ncbi:MAG TPA: gliding motility-associated C-terminal domain-containing protein [Flavipsychrobacter sp.]|nr:gliding motility-associated C-terminal domain-containing protein [Flavipsychrobacter sp.]